jgi:hypothetical protein
MAELPSTTDIITEENFDFPVNSPDNFSNSLATTEIFSIDYVLSEAFSGPPPPLSLSGLGLDLQIPPPSSLRSPDCCLQSRPTESPSTSTLSSSGDPSSGPIVCCQVVLLVSGTRLRPFELNIASCYTVLDIKQKSVEIAPFCCRLEECCLIRDDQLVEDNGYAG